MSEFPKYARPVAGPGLHHVAIKVHDFEASYRFYTETLGMTPVYTWGQGDERAQLLDTGDGSYLEIFAGGKAPAESDEEGPVLHFALRVADAGASFRKAVAAGARPTVEPNNVTIPGDPPLPVRIAFCKGPDGEVIEFFQNEKL